MLTRSINNIFLLWSRVCLVVAPDSCQFLVESRRWVVGSIYIPVHPGLLWAVKHKSDVVEGHWEGWPALRWSVGFIRIIWRQPLAAIWTFIVGWIISMVKCLLQAGFMNSFPATGHSNRWLLLRREANKTLSL